MAAETELERLVVRLVGDGSSYMAMLKGAEQENEKVVNRVEELGKSAAGFLGALGVKEFLAEAKSEWQASETAVFKLNSVLKANGEDVKSLSSNYQEFATNLQKVTVYSDEQVLGLVKVAETFELTGDAAKRAVKDAMALAAATDTSAEAAIRLTNAIEQGDVERAQMYSRMIPQLRGVKDEAEFAAKYQKLVAAGQITLQDELTTGAGRAKAFANQWSDSLEEIGKAYSQVANPVKIVKRTTMDLWNSMGEGAKESTIAVVGWASNVTLAITSLTAISTLLPDLKGNLLAVAKNPFAWAAVATVVVGNLTRELMSTTKVAKDLEKQLDALGEASKGYREAIGTSTNLRVEAAAGRKDELEKLRSDVQKQLQQAEQIEERLKSARPNFATRAASAISGGVGGPVAGDVERFRAQADAAKKETEAWRQQLERVNAEVEKIGRQANKAAIERAVEDTRKAAQNAGLDADQLARKDLVDKGADRAQLAELDRLTSIRKVKEQIASLEKDAKYAGQNEHDKMVNQARDSGADDEDIKRLEHLQHEKDINEELAKTREELKDPQDKLAEGVEKLNEMYDRGGLSADEYARAMENLRNKILGVAAAEQQALQFGSASELQARRQYLNAISTSPNANRAMPEANVAQAAGAAAAANTNDLLNKVLTKLNEAGIFSLGFISTPGL